MGVERVTVIGAGLMGRGIAHAAASGGFETRLHDASGEALARALSQIGRDLDRGQADTFVGMYVNDWTIDFGERGRKAVALLLDRGHKAGIIPKPVELEFIG